MQNRTVIKHMPEVGMRRELTQTSRVMRVAVYCRVSTLKEEQDASFEVQCSSYQQRIKDNPMLELVDVYGDHGITGLSASKRPEFQRMMHDCMVGKVDMVMTKSISRFTRNLADCLEVVRQLREKGIPVLFERECINTMDSSSELLLSVLAAIAQEEVNNMSQNTRWSLDQWNAGGNPTSKARYGYRKEPRCKEQGKRCWLICGTEATRVRFAFEKADKGWKYKKIQDGLNNLEAKEGSTVHWTQERVRLMLANEVYIGDILTNKTYIDDYLTKHLVINRGQRPQYYVEGHHEAIIDKEQFIRVQEKIRSGALHACKSNTKHNHEMEE